MLAFPRTDDAHELLMFGLLHFAENTNKFPAEATDKRLTVFKKIDGLKHAFRKVAGFVISVAGDRVARGDFSTMPRYPQAKAAAIAR